MKLSPRFTWVLTSAVGLILALVYPFSGVNLYYVSVGTYAFFLIVFALSWNLLAYSGQVSFGHAAFLGLGAYGYALLVIRHFPLFIALALGGLFAAAVGIPIGILSLRLKLGFVMGLVTYGLVIIVQSMTTAFAPVTGGYTGLTVDTFSNSYQVQYLILLTASIIVTALMILLFRSRIGQNLSAIREDEIAASSIGIDVSRYKVISFALSALVAGIAGGLFVQYQGGYINANIYDLNYTLWPIIATILGGVNTIAGPIVGSVLLTFLLESTRALDARLRLILVGAILMVIVILAPKGIFYSITRGSKKILLLLRAEKSSTPPKPTHEIEPITTKEVAERKPAS